MRTLTAQEAATLSTRTYVTHLRVRVRRPDLTDVDLGALLGQDWLLGVTWNESTDTPVAQATVSARRNGPGGVTSLSPMVGGSVVNYTGSGSFAPLLKEGRQFLIDVASLPAGQLPSPSDWREVFWGRVDSVDFGPEELRFDGRDYYGGLLQDTFIEAEHNYGNDSVGVAVQDVMASILAENGGVATLYTPVDPMWQLGRFTQKRVPVYEALQQLAAQLGWEVRQVWLDGFGFLLMLRSPDRLASTPVWTFGPDDYVELPVVRRSLAEIRNVVEVVYSDYADRDATNLPKRKTVTSTSPSSVTEYNRRYMQVTEASNSNINSTAEARRLADAAIADLSDSALEVEVSLRASFWPLQVGDMLSLLPDGMSLDTPQMLAVVSVNHAFTSDGLEKTSLKLRGRPSISRTSWMERDAAPGVAALSKLSGPDAPGNVAVASKPGGAIVTFTPAASGPAWDSYELHVSSTPGFTPSNATLKAAQSTTRFEVADLVPTVTYYAKVRGRTAEGNVGTPSSEVTLTPRYVAPVDWQPLVSTASIISNPDFEAANTPGAPPDAWTMANGTWGVDANLETGTVFSGTKAVRLEATARLSRIQAQRFVVRGGERFFISAVVLIQPPSSGRDIAIYVNWFDRWGAFISTTVAATVGALSLASFQELGTDAAVIAPSTASFADVIIGKVSATDAGGLPYYVIIDSVRASLLPRVPGFTPPTFGDGYTSDLSNGRRYVGSRIENGCRLFLRGAVVLSGSGAPGTHLFTVADAHRPSVPETFEVRTSTGSGRLTIFANGQAHLEAGGNAFVSLSGISYPALGA
ncbi:hypothetical protein JY651_28790 [Pyxidicoccus parkwayensis]|uniref:Fibronectin type-III domain-containing protein n=1 Tax=Pyxidicoccus parkwayensis TaxID=2813578 RepID=A0ABX7NP44_9BACT|nr:fibronectin type III domain-containing protein [Pyxidicoccus parkwaysis]QSQ19330.1 hypothetical protein JY651_28790 [Pyxidicoccus parkwaysis]